jgi:hypothetical protein
MNQQILNEWAPGYLQGYNEASPETCHDVDAAYVYPDDNTFQVLQANQQVTVDLVLDEGADFHFNALQWALQNLSEDTINVPGFLYRIKDEAGRFIHEGFVYCYATPGTFANPWPIFPGVTYAQGQRIQAEIINVLDAPQAIQVVFRGFKRFPRVG